MCPYIAFDVHLHTPWCNPERITVSDDPKKKGKKGKKGDKGKPDRKGRPNTNPDLTLDFIIGPLWLSVNESVG